MVELARGGADVVSASRYMRGGHQVGGPLLKRLMSRTAGLTLHWFGGVATHDPTNNFKLYSRRFLDATHDRERGRVRARPRADGQGDPRSPPRRRGPHDLARPDGRPEQLQAPQVAAALPALVLGGDARPEDSGERRAVDDMPRRRPIRVSEASPSGRADRLSAGSRRPARDRGRARHARARRVAWSGRRRGHRRHRVLRPVGLRDHAAPRPRARERTRPDRPGRVLPPPRPAARTRAARPAGVHARPRPRWALAAELAARHRRRRLLYVSNWVQVEGVDIDPLGHTWSLAIEEQFYLLWPLVLILAWRRALWIALTVVAVAFAARVVASGYVEYFSTITRVDAILIGCVVAFARPRGRPGSPWSASSRSS